MCACPECKNEIPKVHVVIDTAHHLMRTWCPFCQVWWSVKCRVGARASVEEFAEVITADGGNVIGERLVVTVCA